MAVYLFCCPCTSFFHESHSKQKARVRHVSNTLEDITSKDYNVYETKAMQVKAIEATERNFEIGC